MSPGEEGPLVSSGSLPGCELHRDPAARDPAARAVTEQGAALGFFCQRPLCAPGRQSPGRTQPHWPDKETGWGGGAAGPFMVPHTPANYICPFLSPEDRGGGDGWLADTEIPESQPCLPSTPCNLSGSHVHSPPREERSRNVTAARSPREGPMHTPPTVNTEQGGLTPRPGRRRPGHPQSQVPGPPRLRPRSPETAQCT